MELLLWFIFGVLACLGGIAQTVAGSVRLINPIFYANQVGRVRRLDWIGAVLSATGLAGAGALGAMTPFSFSAGATAISILCVFGAREIARKFARQRLERFARLLLGDAAALLPFSDPNSDSATPSDTSDETMKQIVAAGEKAGLIQSDEREMISGVFRLDKTVARDIMVPRIDVVAVDAEMPLRQALDIVIAGAHSRVPVFEETIDHVRGLLYAKDLLKNLRDGAENVSIRALLRPVRFVPEAKRLDELLQELQASQVHMAVVVDEYGGTAGIVTIEDILEEIVGEIQDEYDKEEVPLVERLSENEIVVDGRATIDQLNDLLALDLASESDTVAGLVFQKLEKIPKIGDQVRIGNAEIIIEGVLARRIKKVRVRKIPPEKREKREKRERREKKKEPSP
ncbi:MAG: HlyC/CorC family transporter [Chloroflexi bacterium]|nr:HlyC/CorC family transporter [Chloroflexota bacterium]